PLTQTLPVAFSPGARSMVSIWPSYSPSAVAASRLVPSVPVMAKYSGLTAIFFLLLLVTVTATQVSGPPDDSTEGWAVVARALSPMGGLAFLVSPPSALLLDSPPWTGGADSSGTSHAAPSSVTPSARVSVLMSFFMWDPPCGGSAAAGAL